jgi:branched-chain amino acid transport system substrate-binding protein
MSNPSIQIVIEIGSDDNDKKLSGDIAKKFVKDQDIVAVIGHNGSEASQAGADIYGPAGLVMLSPTSFKITAPSKSSIYRMMQDMTSYAANLANHVKEDYQTIDKIKVGTCVDKNSPYNGSFYDQFKKISAGGKIETISLSCPASFKSFDNLDERSKVIKEINNKNINVLLIAPHINTLPQSIKFIKDVRKDPKARKIKLLGSPSFHSDSILKFNQDNSLDNFASITPVFPDPQNKFVLTFSQEWNNQPLSNWRSAMAYASLAAVSQNLDQNPTRQSVAAKMQTEKEYTTESLPSFKFNKDGASTISEKDGGHLIQINGNKFEKIEKLN